MPVHRRVPAPAPRVRGIRRVAGRLTTLRPRRALRSAHSSILSPDRGGALRWEWGYASTKPESYPTRPTYPALLGRAIGIPPAARVVLAEVRFGRAVE